MFQRENAVGLLLLGVCVFVVGLAIYMITTGTRFEYTGPGWLPPVLFVLMIAGTLFGLYRSRKSGGRF